MQCDVSAGSRYTGRRRCDNGAPPWNCRSAVGLHTRRQADQRVIGGEDDPSANVPLATLLCWCRHCDGDVPVRCAKSRLKWAGFSKPTSRAIRSTAWLGSANRDWEREMRICRTNSLGPIPAARWKCLRSVSSDLLPFFWVRCCVARQRPGVVGCGLTPAALPVDQRLLAAEAPEFLEGVYAGVCVQHPMFRLAVGAGSATGCPACGVGRAAGVTAPLCSCHVIDLRYEHSGNS